MTIYFVKSTALDLIKIGYTNDLIGRMNALSIEFLELTLLGYHDGDKDLEKSLHDKFSAFHERGGGFLGREWFSDNRKLRYYISRNCTKPSPDIEVWGRKPTPGIKIRFREMFFDNQVKHGRSVPVSEIARETGISTNVLRKYGYELPMYRVECDNIEKLCMYFECDLSDLIYLEGIDDIE